MIPSQKIANRWHRVAYDMQEAIEYLETLEAVIAVPPAEQPRYQAKLMQALMAAAIVAYARGFLVSRSGGNAAPMVDFKDIPVSGETWASELHENLMLKRNQAIAHGDWVQHSTQLISADLGQGILRSGSIPDIWSGVRTGSFIELSNAVLHFARGQGFDLDMSSSLA